VTLRSKDVAKLKETVQVIQSVLGRISHDRGSPVPVPSGLQSVRELGKKAYTCKHFESIFGDSCLLDRS
jgi:hypothetical protein